MKLVFHGHDERYAVEQSLMSLFPCRSMSPSSPMTTPGP